METKNFSYNSETVDDLIFTLSDNLLLLNIKDQIKNRTSNINYIEIIFDKIDACLANIDPDDTELINTIRSLKLKLIEDIEGLIEENLNIDIELKHYYTNPERFISSIYTFFVLRKEENLSNIIFNFIKREKKSLVVRFKESSNKKDLTYSNNKKELDKEKIFLLMNLNEIIEMVQLIDPIDVVKDMVYDTEEIVGYTILDLMMKEEINFNENFVEQVKNDLEKNKTKVIFNLRNLILEM